MSTNFKKFELRVRDELNKHCFIYSQLNGIANTCQYLACFGNTLQHLFYLVTYPTPDLFACTSALLLQALEDEVDSLKEENVKLSKKHSQHLKRDDDQSSARVKVNLRLTVAVHWQVDYSSHLHNVHIVSFSHRSVISVFGLFSLNKNVF